MNNGKVCIFNLLGLHLCIFAYRIFSTKAKQETSFIRDLMSKTVKHFTTEARKSTLCLCQAMSTKYEGKKEDITIRHKYHTNVCFQIAINNFLPLLPISSKLNDVVMKTN